MHAITKVHSHLGRSILVECTKIEQITYCLKSKLYICMVLGPCVIIKDDMQLLQLTNYYSSAASLSELVFPPKIRIHHLCFYTIGIVEDAT